MKILIDMNLSPDWATFLTQAGWEATHWSSVGAPRATDRTIMDWARRHKHIVLTHDLDFGTILATTHARGPSVIQIRTQDIMVTNLGQRMLSLLAQYQRELQRGALIVVDEARTRVRILSLR